MMVEEISTRTQNFSCNLNLIDHTACTSTPIRFYNAVDMYCLPIILLQILLLLCIAKFLLENIANSDIKKTHLILCESKIMNVSVFLGWRRLVNCSIDSYKQSDDQNLEVISLSWCTYSVVAVSDYRYC
jgi:hypothetical protein